MVNFSPTTCYFAGFAPEFSLGDPERVLVEQVNIGADGSRSSHRIGAHSAQGSVEAINPWFKENYELAERAKWAHAAEFDYSSPSRNWPSWIGRWRRAARGQEAYWSPRQFTQDYSHKI